MRASSIRAYQYLSLLWCFYTVATLVSCVAAAEKKKHRKKHHSKATNTTSSKITPHMASIEGVVNCTDVAGNTTVSNDSYSNVSNCSLGLENHDVEDENHQNNTSKHQNDTLKDNKDGSVNSSTENSNVTANNNSTTTINNSTTTNNNNETENNNNKTKRPKQEPGNNVTTPFIIRGQRANRKQFSCFVQGNGCGGVLIWRDIVLTAAHCGKAFDKQALVGAYRYQSTDFGAKRINVVKSIRHPQFIDRTNVWDYRVVKLERPVELSDNTVIKRCELNHNTDWPRPGMRAFAVGMGQSEYPGQSYTSYLEQAEMWIIDPEHCKDDYNGKVYPNTQLCANGGESTIRGVCFGDSGGPLFDVRGRVVGLTSWGNNDCGVPWYSGVFSKVSTASSWINRLTCQLSQFPPLSRCDEWYQKTVQKLKQRKQVKKRKYKQNKKKKSQQKRNRNRSGGGTNNHNLRNLLWETSSDDKPKRTQLDAESCENTRDLFDLSEQLVDYDCHWLEQQPRHQNRQHQSSTNTTTTTTREELCKHPYIAAKCPKTCRVCHIWDNNTGLLDLEDDD